MARAIERIAPRQMARAIERIDNHFQRLVTNPTLDNFDGITTVRICDSYSNELPTEHIIEDGVLKPSTNIRRCARTMVSRDSVLRNVRE